MSNTTVNKELLEGLDYEHYWNGLSTPLKPDSDALSSVDKIKRIEKHFASIMDTLGLDLTDDSLKETPRRVAKMFVNEAFKGLDKANKPKIKLFKNNYKYKQMLVERDIRLHSYCEHHYVPIVGKAHIAYISNGAVVGLSKLNRLVEYYAKRPQVQERLTEQIAKAMKETLGTEDVAVIVDADHFCVKTRGIQDSESTTLTSSFHGKFENEETRREFLNYINLKH